MILPQNPQSIYLFGFCGIFKRKDDMKKTIILLWILCCTLFVGCINEDAFTGTVTFKVSYDMSNSYYSIEGADTVKRGADYTFKILPKEGYSPAENFTVTVNGEQTEVENMTCTVRNVQTNLSISAKNFVKESYTVKFVIGDKVLESAVYEYGDMPKFNSQDKFVKDYGEDKFGVFEGWTLTAGGDVTPLSPVRGNTTYYAKLSVMDIYADILNCLTVHYTYGTQQVTSGMARPIFNGGQDFDGAVWFLQEPVRDDPDVCLEYTLEWASLNFAEILSGGKMLTFAFAPNYDDFELDIEGKKTAIDKSVHIVKIYNSELYLDGEKYIDIDEDIYNGTVPMQWKINRSFADLYAQIGISHIAVAEIAE